MTRLFPCIALLWVIAFLYGCDAENPTISSESPLVDQNQDAAAAKSLAATDISLYGGKNYRVYLGCWSCPSTSTTSIFNKYGSYGSKYSATSIFNKYGSYGGPNAIYSPCNKYTSTPPKLVDGKGGFYGYLTLNKLTASAVTDRTILSWLTTAVCGGR